MVAAGENLVDGVAHCDVGGLGVGAGEVKLAVLERYAGRTLMGLLLDPGECESNKGAAAVNAHYSCGDKFSS